MALPATGNVLVAPAPFRRLAPILPEVDLLGVGIHPLTERGAVDHILGQIDQGIGGWVVTPNLDHMRRFRMDRGFRQLYEEADLRVADGQILVWACRLQRTPLPERVAGSDLISSLSAAAGEQSRSVFLLGGNEGTAERAGEILRERTPGLRIAGTECPPMGFERDQLAMARLAQRLQEADPDIVFVALGSPKQEIVIQQLRDALPRAWWLGVGISFSFLCGDVERAPLWMRRAGIEWLHRLLQEPRRLFTRYIVHGLPFASYMMARCLLRGMLPMGKRANPYGHRRPSALLVDDDPFALEHLEVLLTSKFPQIDVEKRSYPSAEGDFDFYFIDNDFNGAQLASSLAVEIRAKSSEAQVFAFSSLLDADTLKGLINAGCHGVCDKSDSATWKPVLERVDQRLAEMAEQHRLDTRPFGGVRHAARAIHDQLHTWNEEESRKAPHELERPNTDEKEAA